MATYEEPAKPKAFSVGKWLDKLNNAFTFDEDERFIDDEQFQISREDSKKRILNIMIFMAGFLLFCNIMMLWPIVAYHNFKELQTPNRIEGKNKVLVKKSLIRLHPQFQVIFNMSISNKTCL